MPAPSPADVPSCPQCYLPAVSAELRFGGRGPARMIMYCPQYHRWEMTI